MEMNRVPSVGSTMNQLPFQGKIAVALDIVPISYGFRGTPAILMKAVQESLNQPRSKRI
jgi:hypothetical protein